MRTPPCKLAFFAGALLASGVALAQPVDDLREAERLFVSVVRNQQALDPLFNIQVAGEVNHPRVLVLRKDMQDIGIAVEGNEEMIDLGMIEGIEYRLDRNELRLEITANPKKLTTPMQHLGDVAPSIPELSAGVGGVVADYDWSMQANRDHRQAGLWGDVRTMGGNGQFSHSFRASAGQRSGEEKRDTWFDTVRLDTSWTHHDPVRMRSIELGDTISGSVSWSRPVRLAGVRVWRDFSLQPYRGTSSRLSLAGSAALPSTVELFVDGVLTSQQSVQPGQFELDSKIPTMGAGTATMVLTDLNGQRQIVEVPLYGSANLLEQGLTDSSIEAGFLRRDYGWHSNGYHSSPMTSGSVRHGVSNWLTIEAHAETMEGAGMLGTGAVVRLPGRAGVLNASIAQRFGEPTQLMADQWQGVRVDGRQQRAWGWEWNTRKLGVSISSVRRDTGYFDVAANAEGAPLSLAADQAWVGIPSRWGHWNIGYVRQSSFMLPERQAEHRYASLGWTSSWKRAWASLSVQHGLERGDTQGYLTVSIPLEDRSRLLVARRQDDRRGGQTTASYSKSVQGSTPGWGWRVAAAVDDDQGMQGTWLQVDRLGEVAQWSAGLTRQGQQTTAWGQGQGGWAWIDGMGGRLMRRTDGAFALVETGGIAGVPVRLENRRIGQTDENGRLLVERLLPWQANKISIDTEHLPPNVSISGAEARIAVPRSGQGAMVRFDMHHTMAIEARLVDAAGRDLPAGSTVHLVNASGQKLATSVVGNEGMVWMDATGHDGVGLEVELDDHACQVMIQTQRDPGLIRLGTLPCLSMPQGGRP